MRWGPINKEDTHDREQANHPDEKTAMKEQNKKHHVIIHS